MLYGPVEVCDRGVLFTIVYWTFFIALGKYIFKFKTFLKLYLFLSSDVEGEKGRTR
jgi:hypothetical protein